MRPIVAYNLSVMKDKKVAAIIHLLISVRQARDLRIT